MSSSSTATTTIGQLVTKKLETINPSSTAQEAAKKMRDKKVSSLVVTLPFEDKPIGIVTERDLVRQVCTKDVSSNTVLIHEIMSSPLATIVANSSVEVAADIMIQDKVRHLIVMEDENKVLGIITSSDFIDHLEEKLNLDDVNARILQSLKEEEDEEKAVDNTEVASFSRQANS